ncbi:rab-GTPase-TBC domain-containing protein [Fimicolochytrium jonesii]|uniref:rab-GTPase-TBC domain-containing protein n=1 Tax=Fimicolochytrium jonesii TaxID=1396493 RepID=UPI0022FEE1A6|nr:rab-GTPase-TBC domain-containing protein [Fimicolochytrium jonesii]KAI8825067.1 rab-GTPase-TBC domain-containing protein [Fimicolochytrium jonesii]
MVRGMTDGDVQPTKLPSGKLGTSLARPSLQRMAGVARLRQQQRQQLEQQSLYDAYEKLRQEDRHRPKQHSPPPQSFSAHAYLRQRTRSGPASPMNNEDHRLTLGEISPDLGFDDVLTNLDLVRFESLRGGVDPAAAGKEFAERVFEGLEWDSSVRYQDNESLPRSTRSPSSKFSGDTLVHASKHSTLEKVLEPRKRTTSSGTLQSSATLQSNDSKKSGLLTKMSSFWKGNLARVETKVDSMQHKLKKQRSFSGVTLGSPTPPTSPKFYAVSSEADPDIKYGVAKSALTVNTGNLVMSTDSFHSVHAEKCSTLNSVSTSSHQLYPSDHFLPHNVSATESQRTLCTLESSSDSAPPSPALSKRTKVKEWLASSSHSHLTPPTSPPPPRPDRRKSSDASRYIPPSLSQRSIRSVKSNISLKSARFRSQPREPIPQRKSLDAASRKSSDRFFEFVEELYCRADTFGFVIFKGRKSRNDKIQEAAMIAKDFERCKKWRLMAQEIPVHPAVMEAERALGGGLQKIVSVNGSNVPSKMGLSPIFNFAKGQQFLTRLFKGVPQVWRGHVWYNLITSYSGLYSRMTPGQVGLAEADFIEKYHYSDQPSGHDESIMLAIPKTFANHIWFMQRQGPGQQALAHLLNAYAIYDPDLGYVPGMNSIAAMLLTVMESERAFIALIHLFHAPMLSRPYYNIRTLFTPTGIRDHAIPAHDAMMALHVPRLVTHFERMGISSKMYADLWYRTLFLGLCSMVAPERRQRRLSEQLRRGYVSSSDEDEEDEDEDDEDVGRARSSGASDRFPPDARGDDGKRWEGVLDFATVVKCWDFIAAMGWESLPVVAVSVLKWYEASLLTLDSSTLLTFLLNGDNPDDLLDGPDGDARRRVVEEITVHDPDRFLRLVRRVWGH